MEIKLNTATITSKPLYLSKNNIPELVDYVIPKSYQHKVAVLLETERAVLKQRTELIELIRQDLNIAKIAEISAKFFKENPEHLL